VDEYVSSILMYYNCSIAGGEITDKYFDEHEKEYAKKAEWVDIGNLNDIKFYNSVDSLSIIRKAQSLI
jgi:hypothetical protein